MSNEIFEKYQRAVLRHKRAQDARASAESELIAADRELRDAKRAWCNDRLENRKPTASHG